MDKDNQIKYDPRGWQMPDGKPDKPKGAKNVREYSYDKGHSFCGYRACMQIKGVEYCRYFRQGSLGGRMLLMQLWCRLSSGGRCVTG